MPVSLAEMIAISREWKHQGYPGSRPIIHALPKMRVRVVRETISKLKQRRKNRAETRRKEQRLSIEVHEVARVGVMDAASVTRGEEFIVYRDRASLTTSSQDSSEGYTRSADTLRLLGDLKNKGQLPLVVGSDNGSPFCAAEVENFLKTNQVIHLRSLPSVPQHNASAENAVREFKDLLKIGLTAEKAALTLNDNRLRGKLGWLTSSEINRNQFKPVSQDERTLFYNAARSAIDLATINKKNTCEKRKAEREAILRTLESFSLITITKGRSTHPSKAEAIT